MKYFSITILFLFAFANIKAQKSNPFDSRGLQFVNDLNTILPELQNENLGRMNQSRIDYYKTKMLSDVNLSEQQLGDFLSLYQNNSKDSLISKSNLSTAAKNFLVKFVSPESFNLNFDFDDYNSKVQNSSISELEKELILSFSAIKYHLKNSELEASGLAARNGCDLPSTTGGESTHVSPAGCGLFTGAILGGAGAAACGWPCGAGGFVVGFVIGYFGSK